MHSLKENSSSSNRGRSSSLQILKDSIYSDYTKKVYVNAIKMYSRFFEIKEGDYDNLLTFDKYQTVDMIRKFILYLRNERQLSHGRMNVLFAALKLYYSKYFQNYSNKSVSSIHNCRTFDKYYFDFENSFQILPFSIWMRRWIILICN